MNIKESDIKSSLKNKAIRLLARREYARAELFQKLQMHANNSALINEVLDDLIAKKFQSDERFVEFFIHHRIEQGYGPIRIQYELSQHGISEILIRSYLPQDESYWLDRLHDFYQKRFGDENLTFAEQNKRQRFLLNRGFSSELIVRFFRNYLVK